MKIEYDGMNWGLNVEGYYRGISRGKNIGILLHRYIWSKYFGKIPDGMIVHHIDGNNQNNKLSNLKLMTIGDHGRYHNTGNDYRLNSKLSEETKNKIRISALNNKRSLGHRVTEEAREKMSTCRRGEKHPMFGKKESEETKAKRSKSLKEWWAKKKLNDLPKS